MRHQESDLPSKLTGVVVVTLEVVMVVVLFVVVVAVLILQWNKDMLVTVII